MRDFLKNTSPDNPVLFYFTKAAELAEFERFTVEFRSIARPNQMPALLEVWSVIAKRRREDRHEIVADFPLELYAVIFRDMAEGLTKTAEAVADLVFDLDAIGFADPDADVNGGDAVNLLNEHLPHLRTLRAD
ncbi:MAG: hypothetical protein PHT60_15525 [Acidiphilium sp.]|nr:hypothetical protein [Acidiphilium sp.]MDD4937173.1 hypothetical protein [Acidiphilium sp.]